MSEPIDSPILTNQNIEGARSGMAKIRFQLTFVD
jgi:hypothetical protein